ncbi:aminoglycoside N(3)-acetyltransferase [Virgisporangium aurantiacum]|nr:AAC(3) family N-acetyltransferase [Virgisporangium aurantiacum]
MENALRAAGVRLGRDLLVHCAMRRIGRVDGGPATLLAALTAVVGTDATIVVPAQTTENSVSSAAYRRTTAGMTPAEREAYEERMPGFDVDTTPSQHMGLFAEHVRTRPDAVRSAHPQTSFAAVGARAADLMRRHDLDCHLGEQSPLGGLYAGDADILLLGVGYAGCTALHLAEYRLPPPRPSRSYRCFVSVDGRRVRRDFEDLDLDPTDFDRLGADLDREAFVRHGRVGAAPTRVLPVRASVDFAVGWLTKKRALG